MSEQIFVGLEPTTPEGKEIYFITLDDWTGVAECLLNVIDPGFPFRPTMEARVAIKLAGRIKEELDNGSCTEFSSGMRTSAPKPEPQRPRRGNPWSTGGWD